MPPVAPSPLECGLPLLLLAFVWMGCSTSNLATDTGDSSDVEPCSTCHGSATNAAPPIDTKGNTETSERGVGAHQSHLTAGTLSDVVPCGECHVIPEATTDAGHIDEGPAEVVFGSFSRTGGATPAWNGTSCANTYCHNPDPADTEAKATAPQWTSVDGSQLACDSCHGNPPADHTFPGASDCQACHSGTVAGPDPGVITDKTRHINGVVNLFGD
jgi:predicted CxxxxCH...CXXCH cytochrome family protein